MWSWWIRSRCVPTPNVRLQRRAVLARPLEGAVMWLLDLEHIAQAFEIVLRTSMFKVSEVQPITLFQKTAFLCTDHQRKIAYYLRSALNLHLGTKWHVSLCINGTTRALAAIGNFFAPDDLVVSWKV